MELNMENTVRSACCKSINLHVATLMILLSLNFIPAAQANNNRALGDNTIFAESLHPNKKVIGILTSGGDCSGLNSILRAAYLRAKQKGYKIIGFKYGAHGMINDNWLELNDENCSADLLWQGGSILKCNTKEVCKGKKSISQEESEQEIINTYKKHNLAGLIYIGGDGSTRIMKSILKRDDTLKIVAVPKTIDNDICNTDIAVGFSTAIHTVSQAIQALQSTAKTHERIMVVEVMGRAAGYISLYAGLSSGADVILIPESKYQMSEIYERMHKIFGPGGKKFSIIIVSEAVEFGSDKYKVNHVSDTLKRVQYGGIAQKIAVALKEQGFDAKAVCLGHIQRGGTPTPEDRLLGLDFGYSAINIICDPRNSGNCQLGYIDGKIISIKLDAINETKRNLKADDHLITLASDLGIYIGDF